MGKEEVNMKKARPWDLLNKNIGRVAEEQQVERMAICNKCPFLIKATKTCVKCGCFMTEKTKLPNAECPLHKWEQVDINKVPFTE